MRRTDPHLIDSIAALEARYPSAKASARAKEHRALTPAMREWLARSPFFVLSSLADGGVDCSPRGDAPGEAFRVLDAARIAIPDRRGNNRLDTLRNLVRDPRVGLVFLVPGIEETLRMRGRATVSIAPALLETFRLEEETPASVVVVEIDAVWVQNFRAVRRARLWDEAARAAPDSLPDAAALAGVDEHDAPSAGGGPTATVSTARAGGDRRDTPVRAAPTAPSAPHEGPDAELRRASTDGDAARRG